MIKKNYQYLYISILYLLVIIHRFRVNKIDQNIFYGHGLQEMAVQIPIHCIRSYKEVVRLNNCLSSSQNIFVISQNITIDGGFKSV